MSFRGRVLALFALVMGIVLVAIPVTTNLFGKASDVDDLTDSLRPVFADAALDQADADMTAIEQMAAQLGGEAIPALAVQFGTTPEAFAQQLGTDHPAVGAGMQQLDVILPYFRGIVDGLRAEAGDFRLADAIPTKNLPAIVVPFLFLVPGLVLMAVALVALRRPGSKLVVPVSLAIGAVLVVAPLVLSVPAKTQAVDDLTDAFRPAFSEAGRATTHQHLDTVHAMIDQLTSDALPALADGLGMPVADFQAFLGENFPAVASGLGDIDAILGRFDGLVAGVDANASSFRGADSIPTAGTDTTVLHWLFVVPGLVLLLGAAGLSAWGRVRNSAFTPGHVTSLGDEAPERGAQVLDERG